MEPISRAGMRSQLNEFCTEGRAIDSSAEIHPEDGDEDRQGNGPSTFVHPESTPLTSAVGSFVRQRGHRKIRPQRVLTEMRGS
ncbi:MAG: hypothetical protein ACXVB5_21380, partial [Isosphaeraceae bacterium]